MVELPTSTPTVPPTGITTMEEWVSLYLSQDLLSELEEDPSLKDVIYEDAFLAFLRVGWYDKDNTIYGLADDDAADINGRVDDLLSDDNVAPIVGCSDFFRVWELITLPNCLVDENSKELLRANVSRHIRPLLSWKQQGVYIPPTILSLMRGIIDRMKNTHPEVYSEFDKWFKNN